MEDALALDLMISNDTNDAMVVTPKTIVKKSHYVNVSTNDKLNFF